MLAGIAVNDTVNPPQLTTGKTDITTWNFGALPTITNGDIAATSGYYNDATTLLQLYQGATPTKVTSGFTYSTASLKRTGGFETPSYWSVTTSTKGFNNLVFNVFMYSAKTGPRDFNTEWSTDGVNWEVFGNLNPTTQFTIKNQVATGVNYGMTLPTLAENKDVIHIRVKKSSEITTNGGTLTASSGNNINAIQLYGTKDPAYTTPTVTATTGAIPLNTTGILDVTPITLACVDTNAQIYYTTDGTTPATTEGGSTKLYTAPFTALSEGGFSAADPFVVKAVAKSPTLLTSDEVTLSYNQQIITSNADAKKLEVGTYAWVKGIGTYSNQSRTLYIQDGMNVGSGLCIDNSGGALPSYIGKEIYIYGKIGEFNGLKQIAPDVVDAKTVVVRNDSPILPTPTKVMFDQLSEGAYEGMLVSFDTVQLVKVSGTDATKNYNHTVSQAGKELPFRAKGIETSVGTNGTYVNITKAIANNYNGTQILSSNTADLEKATTPTVEFITSDVATGTAVPLNSKVTLATNTPGATITYSLNGGAQITSTTKSVDATIEAFQNGKATITATATDGTYTTATQTFTYTQSQVANVSAIPGAGAIVATAPITLSTTTDSATIVYSLYKNSYSETDGTLVGDAFQAYTSPITLDTSYFPIRIETKATLANYTDSSTSIFAYTVKKAVGGEKNYYGAIHGHTAENSDGQGTLVEANEYARDQGKFDYFILTDHSNSFDKAPSTDTVATIGDLNNYNTTNQQWVNGKKAAADATTSTFLADYAYEMTWSGGPGHVNTFNTQGFVSRLNKELNTKTNDAGMQAYYQLLKNTAGSITQFNHPGPTFGNFADFGYYSPEIDEKINLIEIGNGEGAVGSGGYFQSINQYILALDKGWHVAPTNNGDNHKKGWGTSNTVATVVYTNDFTMSGIYQAMRDRSVWATENRDLDVTYHLNDGTNTHSMGTILDVLPATANITVTAKNKDAGTETSNIASIQLISNSGKVVNEKTYAAGNSDVTYTYEMTAPAAGYYFAKITDNQGFVALTAPIWIGKGASVGFTEVKKSTDLPVTTEEMTLTTGLFNNETSPATLTAINYKLKDGTTLFTETPNTEIAANGGTLTHSMKYTPNVAGDTTVVVTATMLLNGNSKDFTYEINYNVTDINKVTFIGIDGSHYNEYVAGNYKESMGNFTKLAAASGVRTVTLNNSTDLIAACSNPKYNTLLLTAPTRRLTDITYSYYSDAEIAAITAFASNGGTVIICGWSDLYECPPAAPTAPTGLTNHMAWEQNKLLRAIGSSLRLGDDASVDEILNPPNNQYRLYLPDTFNPNNSLTDGIVPEQTYSVYGGSTVYAVDANDNPVNTLPLSVSPIINGLNTTWSEDRDKDGYGLNDPSIKLPRYGNGDDVGRGTGTVLLNASEIVDHGAKSSLVIVSGGAFMSNFEIQAEIENAGTLPYSNYTILSNIIKAAAPIVQITSIADAKNLADGTDVIIEATATSEINTQNIDTNTNKGFFDCIYAQDATGGINLFPVGSGVKEGQKVRFYGKVSSYQGEVQLNVSKFTILDENINKLAPTDLATKDSMSPSNTGLLLKTQGVVSNINKDADGTINQFTINDGTGPAIVFINGYITKGTLLPFITDGATVSVVGLASIGEVVSDSDMHARIRVRDRAEIVNIEKTTEDIKIEKISTETEFAVGQDAKIIIRATNNLTETKKVTLIIAQYDKNGKLLDYVKQEDDINSGVAKELQGNFTVKSNAAYVKYFVWDSIKGMKPYVDSVKILVK